MATRNAYLAYKRDTSRIIYWVVQTSNAIIKNLAVAADNAGGDGDGDDDGVPKEPNLSGAVTVAGLVTLAKLISKHVDNAPPAILGLFQSVIDARTAAHSAFRQFAARNPDPEILRSNASHKRFIDALVVAFEALGGKAALDSETGAGDTVPASTESKDDLDQLLLANLNSFAALNLQGPIEPEPESDDDTAPPMRRKQAKPGKGKKGKRAKKPKKTAVAAEPEPEVEDVPLESYRIIQDKEGIVTDYLMAVYDLVRHMMKLRGKMQEIWREVAYDGLNTAVAGAVSHIAVGMVQRTAAAMFIDFPGHDSFQTVMDTITRGDVDKCQGMFTMNLFQLPKHGAGEDAHKIVERDVDVKEQFFIHAYRDLLDFVLDFQKTRSGKPTKRMLADIKDWDPNFNLARATNDERIRWRRAYTINWLYDLTNVYSCVVVQRNNVKKEGHVLENVDWSPKGPWSMHRVLFGLQDFASFVTTLAMQKPGTDVRKRILPHHVFQLQCIVDSLAVSRGWSVSPLRGHIVVPPARGFRPRREVDLFMDRNSERMFQGYAQGAFVLEQILEKDSKETRGPSAYDQLIEITKLMRLDFQDWLGESKYKYGLNTIPPSRFSNTDSNGLWEYSPFLCGVGLAEALQLAYKLGMWLWDKLPDITYMVHLHNMLHQRGFIKQPVGLYASLEEFFPKCFYEGGKIPTSDFADALARHGKYVNQAMRLRHRETKLVANDAGSTIHELIGVDLNAVFTVKSDLILYHQANWNPDRIPDADIPLASLLQGLRLSQTKRVVDPATGKLTFEETDLVRRMREQKGKDASPDFLNEMAHRFETKSPLPGQPRGVPGLPGGGVGADWQIPESVRQQILQQFPGYELKTGLPVRGQQAPHTIAGHEIGDDILLDMYKMDLQRDVCGVAPRSSLNYAWVTARIKTTLMQIEAALKKGRYSLYREAYESGAPELGSLVQKRFALVHYACISTDDEALRAIAAVFENPRAGFMNHIYWDDLVGEMELPATTARREQENIMTPEPDGCLVM
ncbi:hypothetical protein B0T19DRAFT_435196 [Cercophora scortea]|uniref:DUF6604 domain-containing protein n=1 Tax=Cercophora scortea TaxID=314031 RepID=A0AAE0I345_9PEZI|nr:hypothetical protein B0T19DRAFT_435196 [Cercophora scortea]